MTQIHTTTSCIYITPNENMMSISLIQIPREILTEIFRLIPIQERKLSSQVCKVFNEVINKLILEAEEANKKRISEALAKIITQYPPDLIEAVGGAEKFYYSTICSDEVLPNLDKWSPIPYAPTRGDQKPFFVFSVISSSIKDKYTYVFKPDKQSKWTYTLLEHRYAEHFEATSSVYSYVKKMFNGMQDYLYYWNPVVMEKISLDSKYRLHRI